MHARDEVEKENGIHIYFCEIHIGRVRAFFLGELLKKKF